MTTAILYMPEGYTTMSEGAKKNICNGCGSDSTECVPEHIWGLRVSEACNIHDYMYHFAEARIEAKQEADRVFLNNMLRSIDRNTKKYLINLSYTFKVVKWRFTLSFRVKNPLLWLRRRAAYMYYESVKKFGGPAFWAGKNDSKNLGEEI